MSHARLNPGEANSGKLVTFVRHNAKQIAEKENRSLILIDGPPGIGCPVIASVSGVDVGLRALFQQRSAPTFAFVVNWEKPSIAR